jgi:lysyl-tRNA synthetase class I
MDDQLSPNQIKQMISMLQQMLPQTEDTDEPPEPQKEESVIKTVNRRPKQTENKFDQMMEAHLHKEDIEVDKRLRKYDPTPRIRKFDPIKVTCRVCGKSEEVNPVVLTDSKERYKCNNCSRSAG